MAYLLGTGYFAPLTWNHVASVLGGPNNLIMRGLFRGIRTPGVLGIAASVLSTGIRPFGHKWARFWLWIGHSGPVGRDDEFVGATGFEPVTSCPPGTRSTGLSHAPIRLHC